MPNHHLGTLDAASKLALSEGDLHPSPDSSSPRSTFLQPRFWTKSLLHSKRVISSDTRIFTFALEHPAQTLGLPIGQHLMLRLRDPVTRDAIIRPYTPISETSKPGFVDVLVKVYFDTPNTKGGRMTKAMEALPIGHAVDFKGPIGKFEYIGAGLCAINGVSRRVSGFAMICAGSGITPIFQVFRAVTSNPSDPTTCTIINGNRLVEDILCKEDLDALVKGNEDRVKVVYTLTKAPNGWEGLKGRIGGDLIREHCGRGEGTMVLVCGPEAMEKSVHTMLKEEGWKDEDILFF